MVRLIADNGAAVDVPEKKVDGLLARGFTRADETKKTAAKKASSSKSSK